MKAINENYERQNVATRMLVWTYSDNITNDELSLKFSSLDELKDRIKQLETKLSSEQILIAFMKAERLAADFIQKENENAGWRSWIPGVFKGATPKSGKDSWESTTVEDFDSMIESYQELKDMEEEPNMLEETKS